MTASPGHEWPALPELEGWCRELGGRRSGATISARALARALERALRLAGGKAEHAPAALFYALADARFGARPVDPELPGYVVRQVALRAGRQVQASSRDLAAVVRLIQADRVGLGAVAAWLDSETVRSDG